MRCFVSIVTSHLGARKIGMALTQSCILEQKVVCQREWEQN